MASYSHSDIDWKVLALFKALIKAELQTNKEEDSIRSNPPAIIEISPKLTVTLKDFRQRENFLIKKVEEDNIQCKWIDAEAMHKALERTVNQQKIYPTPKTLECLFQLLLKEKYNQYMSWLDFKEKETKNLINATKDILTKRFIEIFSRTYTSQSEFTNNIPSYFDDEFYDEDNSSLLLEIGSLINSFKIVCLYGVPGVGKSFLAMKAALESQEQYDLVWIISADDVSTIENSLEKFAERLFGETEVSKEKSKGGINIIIERLRSYLVDRSWLLVYDNAGDSLDFTSKDLRIIDFMEKYFLHKARVNKKKQKILIATRNEDWANTGLNYFGYKRIEYWSNKKIKSYLESNSHIKIDNESQLSILEGIPLIASIAKEVIRNSESPNNFEIFLKEWEREKKQLLSQTKYRYELGTTNGQERIALATTIQLTYIKLPKNGQNLLKTIAHFASNGLLYSISKDASSPFYLDFYSQNSSFINKWLKIEEKSQFDKLLNRLSKFSLLRKDSDKFSMHEFIQTCVLLLEKVGENAKSYNKAIQLLINVVADWGIASLPHTDQFLKNLNQYITYMSDEEKNQAAKLFSQSGQLHSQQGHNKVAEEHFRKGLEIVKDEAIEAELNKKLANVLFLKGGLWIDEASVKAEKALKYYVETSETLHDPKRILEVQKNILEVRNDVINKIYQRQCRFEECEQELKEAQKIALDNAFEDKLSGIYHNFGSLYWTWGRDGDYEKSDKYFEKVYQVSKNDFGKSISKMIHGAVLGLLCRYEDQERVHKEAFDFFEKVGEQRRYTYTAYYQLVYGWDKEKITNSLPVNFAQDDLIKKVRKYESTLIDVDEKYQVIEKTIRLRLAIIENDTELASKAYEELWNQLQDMKSYTKKPNRFYDVDCLSVSGLVDYASYLVKIDKSKSKEVTENARDMVKEIEYPRRKEINKLLED